jgi:hypothetical protein
MKQSIVSRVTKLIEEDKAFEALRLMIDSGLQAQEIIDVYKSIGFYINSETYKYIRENAK